LRVCKRVIFYGHRSLWSWYKRKGRISSQQQKKNLWICATTC